MLRYGPGVREPRPSSPVQRVPSVLRRCACSGSAAGGECAECTRKSTALQRSARTPLLQREESGGTKAPTDQEKYQEAAKKTGAALLETEIGKEIKKKAAELGKAFLGSLGGKIVTGAAAAGAISHIVAKNRELPAQLPAIPLDGITSGLKASITYEGPVRSPTKAMITFTYAPGSGSKPRTDAPVPRDRFRAETAKLAAEQARFREGLKSPEERAAEQVAFDRAYQSGLDKFGLRPLPLSVPAGVEAEKKPEDAPLLRAPAGETHWAEGAVAPPIVHDVLAGSGAALPAAVRASMEQRFGHDFSHVRIHADARASASATAVDARAYTVGRDVVFATGEYAPGTETGRRLLAHELAHVMQQDAGRASSGARAGITVGAANDPQEAEATTLADAATRNTLAVPAQGKPLENSFVHRTTKSVEEPPL